MGHWTPSIKLHHITEILASLQGRGPEPHVDAPKLHRWVCSCVPACTFTCVFDGEAVNRATCVYSACCRRLDSPFTIVGISSLSAGAAIDPPGHVDPDVSMLSEHGQLASASLIKALNTFFKSRKWLLKV